MLYIIFARVGVSTLMVVFFFCCCWNYSCLEFSVGILGNIIFALVLCPIRMFVMLHCTLTNINFIPPRAGEKFRQQHDDRQCFFIVFFYLLKYMFYIQKSFGPRQKMYIYFFNFASPSMGFKTTCNILFSCDFFYSQLRQLPILF